MLDRERINGRERREAREGGGKGENAQQTSSYAPKAEPTQEAH